MNLRGRPVSRRATAFAALFALAGIGYIVHEVGPAGVPGFLLFSAFFVPLLLILYLLFHE